MISAAIAFGVVLAVALPLYAIDRLLGWWLDQVEAQRRRSHDHYDAVGTWTR